MNNAEYIEKIIDIKIDRLFGSKLPQHGFIYPVNYGFIPNTISGDNKLIIVPNGKNYSDDAINALAEFQERHFEHTK